MPHRGQGPHTAATGPQWYVSRAPGSPPSTWPWCAGRGTGSQPCAGYPCPCCERTARASRSTTTRGSRLSKPTGSEARISSRSWCPQSLDRHRPGSRRRSRDCGQASKTAPIDQARHKFTSALTVVDGLVVVEAMIGPWRRQTRATVSSSHSAPGPRGYAQRRTRRGCAEFEKHGCDRFGVEHIGHDGRHQRHRQQLRQCRRHLEPALEPQQRLGPWPQFGLDDRLVGDDHQQRHGQDGLRQNLAQTIQTYGVTNQRTASDSLTHRPRRRERSRARHRGLHRPWSG